MARVWVPLPMGPLLLIPAALTLCFAFLTVRKDEMTVLDYLKYAIRYFLTDQQYYEWK